ncbi:DEAD/DEAH box helicase family protein [Brachybacterium paraconglomeratum]
MSGSGEDRKPGLKPCASLKEFRDEADLRPPSWEVVRARLRPYQQDAVQTAETFLEACDPDESRSFLLTMPTGSGKSGVIAYLAQRHARGGGVLLLCPWDALATQLGSDVEERFWRHARIDSDAMVPVTRILPSNAEAVLEASEGAPAVWVMTLAALQQLTPQLSARLRSRLELVIVDEGHYEPAVTWARAVRSLARPTLIFTATPFRNDRKYFAIEPSNSFHYPVGTAIEEGWLRRPNFDVIDGETIDEFGRSLTRYIDAHMVDDDRVVVRCATQQDVRDMVTALRAAGASAIGIHQRFSQQDAAAGLLHRVPAGHHARYWVHQNKLIEGIDNGSFRALAVYAPFRNHRALVQQIGRVLRDPQRNPEARVLAPDAASLKRAWEAFVAFDEVNDVSTTPVAAIVDVARQVSGYVGGAFRSPLSPDDLAESEIRLPTAVTACLAPANVSDPFADLTALVEQSLEHRDAELVGPRFGRDQSEEFPDAHWALQLHVVARQSPLLAESAFVDSGLGFTFFAVVGRRVYVQSTVAHDLATRGYNVLPAADLRQAFDETRNRFTRVTLQNSDLSLVAERSRSQSANSLIDLSPDLGDYFKAPSTISGQARSVATAGSRSSDRVVSRYVGFTNGRVREDGRLDVSNYLRWLRMVDEQLNRGAAAAPIFDRYAEPFECEKPVARNVLIDFPGMANYVDDAGRSLVLEDVCVDVVDGAFALTLEGSSRSFPARISWTGTRYELRCDEIDTAYRRADERSATFSAEVSEKQAFRVIVTDGPKEDQPLVFYVNSGFFRPRVSLALDDRTAGVSLNQLLGTDKFTGVTSEKGGLRSGPAWEPGSLFAFICDSVAKGNLLRRQISTDAILVCDDDARETADFYLVDPTARRLTVIHAKAKDSTSPGYGASGLHDVIAQAQKHLGTIRPGAEGFNSSAVAVRWSANWNASVSGGGISRLRSTHTAEEAAAAAWAALRDPSYEREVLVVASGILSKQEFIANARKPRPQALQALYLMQAAWSAVGSIGARLRIVVNP